MLFLSYYQENVFLGRILDLETVEKWTGSQIIQQVVRSSLKNQECKDD